MEQTDSLIGGVVDGRYLMTARLARGGMAVVYRARDKRLERDVAIKLMHPHLAEQPDFTERFNKEARAAAGLSSPYVVAVYDQGEWRTSSGPHAYLTMEYIAGPDVRSELRRLGSLSLGNALTITEQTLSALATAHAAGVVHRDVKPENIMLSAPLPPLRILEGPDILAKVTDFGLARAVSASTTTSSIIMGTAAYMAPEIVTANTSGPASDVYAVGIMLYELLTGSLPFQADTPIATAYRHVNEAVPRVADQAEWLPPEIDSFIALLTAKTPADRPADGKAALGILRTIVSTLKPELAIRRIPVAGTGHQPNNEAPAATQALAEHTTAMEALTEHTTAMDAIPAAPASESDATVSQPPVPDATKSRATASKDTEPNAPTPNATASYAAYAAPSSTSTPPQIQPAHHTVAMTAAVQPEPATKKKRWWILAVVLALLIAVAAGLAWYFLAGPGQRVTVPDVVGQTSTEATQTLEKQGFAVSESRQYSDEVEADHVISTDPAAGQSIHPDSAVSIDISQGVEQVEVPDVVGTEAEEATQQLKQSRLESATEEAYSEDVPEGTVISQDVDAGTKVDHSSTITLTVSKGRQPIDVPSVAGQSEDHAVAAIEEAGLTANVEKEHSDDIDEGEVISQSPDEGTLFTGDPVTITVSEGPETTEVPDVTYLSERDAIDTLEDAGFSVKTEEIYGGFIDIVRDQNPKAGEEAEPGSEITISVM